MSCTQHQEQISAFVDGHLPDEEASSLFSHIGSCAVCRSFFRASIGMRAMLVKLPVPPVPGTLDTRVLRIPLEGRRKSLYRAARTALASAWRLRFRIPAPAVAAGVVLCILSAVLSVWLLLDSLHPAKQEVVYIFNMPQVEVYGTNRAGTENIME